MAHMGLPWIPITPAPKSLIPSLASLPCPGLEVLNSTELGPGKPGWVALLQEKVLTESLLILF